MQRKLNIYLCILNTQSSILFGTYFSVMMATNAKPLYYFTNHTSQRFQNINNHTTRNDNILRERESRASWLAPRWALISIASFNPPQAAEAVVTPCQNEAARAP